MRSSESCSGALFCAGADGLRRLIAEQEVRVGGGEADPDRAAEEVVRVIVEEVSWPGRAPLTEAGEEALRDRLSAHFPSGPAPEI